MLREKWKKGSGSLFSARRGWLLAMLRLMLLISGAVTQAYANEKSDIDGEMGVLQVHGALSESACRLDMASAWQEVELGNVATGRMRKVGDRGTPIVVQLKLNDCVSGPARTLDDRSGNLRWSPGQPAAIVSFIAPADEDNPQLVQVQGARGVALRITDKLGRDVRLGSKGASLLLTPGDNQLTYTVTPERTRAPLYAGAFSAKINVGLSYE